MIKLQRNRMTISNEDEKNCRRPLSVGMTTNNRDVDVLLSVIGETKSPPIPLQQEYNVQGIEIVHNARGSGLKVICEKQRRQKAKLLQEIAKIEIKLND